MREKHIKDNVSNDNEYDRITYYLSKVFEFQYRHEIDLTIPYIDITFFKNFMSNRVDSKCGVKIIEEIISMIRNEQIPENIIEKYMEHDREDEDVENY